MRIAVPTERVPGEKRVALTPAAARKLVGLGHQVAVESGAGVAAGSGDAAYRAAGAEIVATTEVYGEGGVVVQVRGGPGRNGDERPRPGPGHVLIGLHDPLGQPGRIADLASSGATVLALELVPRTTRAQSMDVLSSMATVAGYEAALLAASTLPHLFPLLMTAAGTVPAARVVVLGAGVAGLQAIATCRRLGAVVEGYDIRPAAMEQIRSLGARVIEIDLDPVGSHSASAPGSGSAPREDASGYATTQSDATSKRQHELLGPHIAGADAVISTAAVPGATSPELITTAMVEAMRPGSVVVDLAAERGGNCRLTRPDEVVDHGGVTILGPTDLASRAAATASQLYATNMAAYLQHLAPDGEVVLDREDEIVAATLVAEGGAVVNQQVLDRLDPGPNPPGRSDP